jgi:hypothetical protein
MRPPAQHRHREHEQCGDQEALREPERDEEHATDEPDAAVGEQRGGHERSQAQERERDEQVQKSREAQIALRHGQSADPGLCFVAHEQAAELAEQRYRDEHGADRQREDRVRERRQLAAHDSAQDRGEEGLHQERRDRRARSVLLRREPRAQKDQDPAPHARAEYSSAACSRTPPRSGA